MQAHGGLRAEPREGKPTGVATAYDGAFTRLANGLDARRRALYGAAIDYAAREAEAAADERA